MLTRNNVRQAKIFVGGNLRAADGCFSIQCFVATTVSNQFKIFLCINLKVNKKKRGYLEYVDARYPIIKQKSDLILEP